jgi:pilus assembly protein Flp/PilA
MMKQQKKTESVLRTLRNDTRGAGLVEYIILVGAIALLTVAGFKTFGDNVHQKALDLGKGVTDIGK